MREGVQSDTPPLYVIEYSLSLIFDNLVRQNNRWKRLWVYPFRLFKCSYFANSYTLRKVINGLCPVSWTILTRPASSKLLSARCFTPRDIRNLSSNSFGSVTDSLPHQTDLKCRRIPTISAGNPSWAAFSIHNISILECRKNLVSCFEVISASLGCL